MLEENHGCFLRFALGSKEESIDGFDKQYLAMLGFSLRSAKDQLVVADVAETAIKDRSFLSDDKVIFVHCCFERGNILSRPTEGKRLPTSPNNMFSRMPTR